MVIIVIKIHSLNRKSDPSLFYDDDKSMERGGRAMFEEELLNNVMERCSSELEENIYRKISRIFIEEHLKLLKTHESQVKLQIGSVSRILQNLASN
jgi:hypothetical protein